MFFSKVTLKQGQDLFTLLKQRKGNDGYIAHQLLWDLFPNDGEKKRDFLFHKDDKAEFSSFLLVSEEMPVANKGLSVVSKYYNPQLSEGQKLAFTLNANPVVSRKMEGKKSSVKHDVWMDAKKQSESKNLDKVSTMKACEDASKGWLIRQGERCGFQIEKSDILIDGYIQNRFYKRGKDKSIRFSSIHYDGVLTVTDSDLFTKMLFTGIGRSKAFGCGLMLVRRV